VGVGFGDTPYGDQVDMLFTPTGDRLVTLTGDLSPDMCTNVGVSILEPSGSIQEPEPAECSYEHIRSIRLSPKGDRLYFLDPNDDQLDVVSVDLQTRERRWEMTSPASERGFVVVAPRLEAPTSNNPAGLGGDRL
jgi:hypothetical protein